jgi:uncharacterized protein (TIGR00251 family)
MRETKRLRRKARNVAVSISVKPGARRPGITVENDAIVVRVRERAIDGAANEAVIRAIAERIGIPLRDVTIVRGLHSRAKLVAVADMPDDALRTVIIGQIRSSAE